MLGRSCERFVIIDPIILLLINAAVHFQPHVPGVDVEKIPAGCVQEADHIPAEIGPGTRTDA